MTSTSDISSPATSGPGTSGPWFDRLGVFDLETTGIDTETSRIVSAYVGVIDADGAPKGVSWLADPGVEIPSQATAVHGITTERARAEGRSAPEVVAEIVAVLRALLAQGVPLVVYNAAYDLTLLHHECLRYGIEPLIDPTPVIDPLVIDRAMDRYRKGKRTLEAAAEFYGVELMDAHDAEADAVAAGRVAQAIARKYSDTLGDDVVMVHTNQVAWASDSAASFQEYMRRTKDPAFVADGVWPMRAALGASLSAR
ncbi:3'-5' exonuclease [Lacisediminihabitans changchengi]|uniref:3'-5' exonuclease n=1 Tax=Lacisediminihabitans changchengi TaxID=2787634 RepID=A0A934SHR2_9MICO|nr:3'-5' exonuclease [Lacisediminihabitans changchengi]MBK4346882.1 3'-5' exonuclease [Lacisediminihabitans changchengi]MBK4347995.1 3'-5' exonuclease [Lacisediminihabitans changchengi]